MRRLSLNLLLILLGFGCSDEGSPLDPTTVGGDTVSFVKDVQPLFDVHCVECHGSEANGGLDLRGPQSYDDLVDVEASGYDAVRVLPGQPDASVLYVKVSTDGQFGDRMPLGGPYLDPEETDLLRQWIAQGAQPD